MASTSYYYNHKCNGNLVSSYVDNYRLLTIAGYTIRRIKDVRESLIVGATHEVWLGKEFVGYAGNRSSLNE